MAGKKPTTITMRVRVGEAELEVTGPPEFVEAKIESFLKQHGAPKEQTKGLTEATPSHGLAPLLGKKQGSLAQLFKKVSVKSDLERALVAGYYLETSQGAESFTAAEVRDAIRGAKVRPPTNPSDAIAKNIKKGLMMSAGDKDGKMAFVLTTDGEEAVAALING